MALERKGIFGHGLWGDNETGRGDPARRRLIDGGLRGASVTVLLAGLETYGRRWVRYGIEESLPGGDDGYHNMATWVEGAAQRAGR
ncbi:TIR domain-containing protein [Actinophytocola sp.]|uniref:TIR domain-containing protein n=1 Tax=Actinophytocola sp. TaxID=1872138 RepID=UPI002ED9B1FB